MGVQVHFFVLDRAPQSFDEHVVAPGASSIHRNRDIVPDQRTRERGAGELAALIGVENIGPAVALKQRHRRHRHRPTRQAAG